MNEYTMPKMTGDPFVLSLFFWVYKTNGGAVVFGNFASLFIKSVGEMGAGALAGVFGGLWGCIFVFLCIYIGMRCPDLSCSTMAQFT